MYFMRLSAPMGSQMGSFGVPWGHHFEAKVGPWDGEGPKVGPGCPNGPFQVPFLMVLRMVSDGILMRFIVRIVNVRLGSSVRFLSAPQLNIYIYIHINININVYLYIYLYLYIYIYIYIYI